MITYMRAWMSSKFSQIWSGTTELAALEHLKNRCCPFFSFHSCGYTWEIVRWAFTGPLVLWFLAHLSQRLKGELIVYPWSGVRPSVVRPSFTISNIFFSETAWPIKAKFYVEPHWVGGTKVCSRHLGHMTKMAATPIYGKNPSKIFFSRTGRRISTKLGM